MDANQAYILSPPVIGLQNMWKIYGQDIDNDMMFCQAKPG